MSSGHVHDKLTNDITLPCSLFIGVIVFIFSHDLFYGLTAFILCLLGIQIQRLFTPDLDIISNKKYHMGYYGFYLICRRCGYIPSQIVRYYWWPYGKIISHRSIFSHGFIIGTLVRLIYLILPMFLLLYIIYPNQFGLNLGYILYYWDYISYFIIGFFLADCGHLILDYIWFVRIWYERIRGT